MTKIRVQDLPYKASYLGIDIYIEPNPDQYREGFCWSISKNEQEHNCGLEFDIQLALIASYNAVEIIVNSEG
ncbi:hypothetical protein [Rheinheimera salexigens]|uniref:Uncharacterized protein n=1 Tax=Rheinheimera salexigens TaxID=1628148 RepID=A0A1E7Q3R6_9GAMM|nr:hypothetical protein [Rheinheimera salexigens]OEY68713.1 hypothetical protein BI198_03355 [Rheinheimera salexigens]